MSRRGFVGWALVFVAGCTARATLPYDVSRVVPRDAPVHDASLALFRLVDARPARESPRGDDRFVYRGLEYRGTVVDRLGVDPMAELTYAVARHLARARVFSRVYAIGEGAEPPSDAAFLLEGRVVRVRGYVEAEAPAEDSGRAPTERKVVAEVRIDFSVRRPDAPVLARFDVGWSFHDERAAVPQAPDPWAVAAEALGPALEQLVRSLSSVDLEAAVKLDDARWPEDAPRLSMGAKPQEALPAQSPPGWGWTHSSTAATPEDWQITQGPRCHLGTWAARQEHRFLRRLGPYVPAVELWWCSDQTGLRWVGEAEFPARYLGTDGAGRRWWGRQVGPSSWPGAVDAFAARAGLMAPSERYVFSVEPGGHVGAPEDSSRPLRPAGAEPRR